MIVDEIFKDISKDDLLAASDLPWIQNFILATNNAMVDEGLTLARISQADKCFDLEFAFRQLPAHIQVKILYEIVVSRTKKKTSESDATKKGTKSAGMDRHDLKMKIWKHNFIRVTLYTIFVFVVGYLGMSLFISIKTMKTVDAQVISTVLKTFVDLLKIIFT